MPIQWARYDEWFSWRKKAKQLPMNEAERKSMEDKVANLLELAQQDYRKFWGEASPPGRYAATVFHIRHGVRHRYHRFAADLGLEELGIKVFKPTPDAVREAKRLIPFHRDVLKRLPGLSRVHAQRSLTADVFLDGSGEPTHYIVQEWVVGDNLEYLLGKLWAAQPISSERVRSLLRQLFGQIILPLWEKGTVWWDMRDANYCYATDTDKLTLIDIDSLAAYADEILKTPDVWERRDRGRRTALARLRRMVLRILMAQGMYTAKTAEGILHNAWSSGFEQTMSMLGKRRVDATAALDNFMGILTPVLPR